MVYKYPRHSLYLWVHDLYRRFSANNSFLTSLFISLCCSASLTMICINFQSPRSTNSKPAIRIYRGDSSGQVTLLVVISKHHNHFKLPIAREVFALLHFLSNLYLIMYESDQYSILTKEYILNRNHQFIKLFILTTEIASQELNKYSFFLLLTFLFPSELCKSVISC